MVPDKFFKLNSVATVWTWYMMCLTCLFLSGCNKNKDRPFYNSSTTKISIEEKDLESIAGRADFFFPETGDEHFLSSSLLMSTGPDKNIYITDKHERTIFKVDRKGKLMSSFGRAGQGPGEFVQIVSFCLDRHHNVYVLDSSQSKIVIFKPDGTLLKEIDIKNRALFFSKIFARDPDFILLNSPDPDGNLLHIYNSEGTHLKSMGEARIYSHPLFSESNSEPDLYNTQIMNQVEIIFDKDENMHALFLNRPLYHKYSPDGKLLLQKQFTSKKIKGRIERIKEDEKEKQAESQNPRRRSIYPVFTDFFKLDQNRLAFSALLKVIPIFVMDLEGKVHSVISFNVEQFSPNFPSNFGVLNHYTIIGSQSVGSDFYKIKLPSSGRD